LRVGFILNGSRETASARLRGYNLIGTKKDFELFDSAQTYDVVVFQKRFSETDRGIASWLKDNSNTKIGFDICDNYFIVDDERKKRLKLMCETADFVTTCSDTLTSIVKKINPNAYTISDGVPTIAMPKRHWQKEKPIILWFGNHGERVGQVEHGMGDLLMIKDCLEDLAKNFSFKFLVVSNSREKWQRLISPWRCETEYQEWTFDWKDVGILESDICVVPVIIDQFSSCKSNNRILEVMQRRIPVLASPIPAYQDTIIDSQNGFLCSGPKDFSMNLSTLLTSWQLRQKIGEESRRTVLADHLIGNVSQKWSKLFKGIVDEGPVCLL